MTGFETPGPVPAPNRRAGRRQQIALERIAFINKGRILFAISIAYASPQAAGTPCILCEDLYAHALSSEARPGDARDRRGPPNETLPIATGSMPQMPPKISLRHQAQPPPPVDQKRLRSSHTNDLPPLRSQPNGPTSRKARPGSSAHRPVRLTERFRQNLECLTQGFRAERSTGYSASMHRADTASNLAQPMLRAFRSALPQTPDSCAFAPLAHTRIHIQCLSPPSQRKLFGPHRRC